ncbi:MAG: phospholipase D-like domain-containing protein [Bacteroidales bacterium]|nr:phospholipase D-like domain-containing protein [Bacteroidales bacterium]
MPKIFDNIELKLTEGLNYTLELSNRTDFCVGYFNLRGWKEVAGKVENLSGSEVKEGPTEFFRYCRLLVGMQKLPVDILKDYFKSEEEQMLDQKEALKLKQKLAQEFKDQLIIGIPTEEDEKALRVLSRQLKEHKVTVKLHLRYPLHAKLYLAYSNDKRVPVVGFMGSSNLTLAGLVKQGELNVDIMEQDAAQKLAKWFDDRWNDRWCIDITNELIEIIDNSWAADRLLKPYYLYLKMAYHLSQEARAGLSEFKIPLIFRKELLSFQQAAVLIAAKKLNSRDGVFIGDVVGLGKTITSCALAKIFEEDFFYSTLIICPPNLKSMWAGYIEKYDLKACIISIGEVQKKLPDMKRFKMIIIDESHNLRNDQGSRYNAIKEYIKENEPKVILLSATPYNKSYIDLSNQLRLFVPDDKDLGISPENYINSIGGQIKFSAEHSETFIRSIKAFEKSTFADDWRELMRLFLVRRTRSFVKDNYAQYDEVKKRKYLTFPDGTRSYFPDRIPMKIEFDFDPDNPKDQYAQLYSQKVVDSINSLNLPRYGLGNYLVDRPAISPNKEEMVIIDNLSRAGKRLMGFCRTNLFKRLESSGFSFLISLSRHVLRNYVFFYAIQNKLSVPIGKSISQNLDGFLEDADTDENGNGNNDNSIGFILNETEYLSRASRVYETFNSKDNHDHFDWIRSEFFDNAILKQLEEDSKKIIDILNITGNWNIDNDRKLKALKKLISEKHKNEKILVFTQFADTAEYVSENLKKMDVKHIEAATGNSDNPTSLADKFSPVSNKLKPSSSDIRVLISTDVLSEGQNLQDSHLVVNYDLPWAIIRLIQRAGRVDRIGQKADEIICYSFLPEDGIERIINLRRRLTNRIRQNAEVVGSDEVFFEGDPVNIEDLYTEKSGILDDDETGSEVDLASYAYQIWKNAIDANPELKKSIPNLPDVVYATKSNNCAPENEGVIVYTRTVNDNDILAWVDKKGKIITQSQLTILKAAACTQEEPPRFKIPEHHSLVKKGVEFIKEDEKNSGGSLGRKTGVKYRVYLRLDNYCKEYDETLFINDSVKKAVDDIYKYPLKEFARETLNRQLKSGISDEDLVQLVVSLREEDKLCISEIDEMPAKEPQIICSLGLINQ